MTKQEQIAAFIDQHTTFPRAVAPHGHQHLAFGSRYAYPYSAQPRPTAEQIAAELMQLAEFRALQLGTWLGTTDGQIIAQAVEMVMPPLYRQDAELLVAALTHAARLQQREGQTVAGRVALVAVGIAGTTALALWASGSTAPRG